MLYTNYCLLDLFQKQITIYWVVSLTQKPHIKATNQDGTFDFPMVNIKILTNVIKNNENINKKYYIHLFSVLESIYKIILF